MNKLQTMQEIWALKQVFEMNDSRHINCIRINKGSTYEHELEKFNQCWKLAQKRVDFICEGKLARNGKRPDITALDPEYPYHIEIMKSETDEMCDNKDYPFEVRKIKI